MTDDGEYMTLGHRSWKNDISEYRADRWDPRVSNSWPV